MEMLLPPPVAPGECIGLFSPSGPVRDPDRFEAGLRLLQGLGFRTKQYQVACSGPEYLAADDRSRAEEFRAMWNDPDVHAMMAVRGGYGCLRMLPHLDLGMLRERPKLVIGFSDLTVLLNTLADRAGIITYHGPVLTSLADADKSSVASFVSQLSGSRETERVLEGLMILRGGEARGIIRGGNLTTISHLLGTPWEIPFRDTLLFIEDTGEPMYRIDRVLTQLYVSGRLDHLSGLLLGTFDCGPDPDKNLSLRDEVWQRVLELTSHCGYPVWGNFPIGHLDVNHTFPVGMPAVMHSRTRSLEFKQQINLKTQANKNKT